MSYQTVACIVVLVIIGLVAWVLPHAMHDAPARASEPDACASFKQLTLPEVYHRMGNPGQSPIITNLQDLIKAFGEDTATHLASQIDFKKQNIVAIGYETTGPPFGKPACHVQYYDDVWHRCMIHFGQPAFCLVFHIREPVGPNETRNITLKRGLDFFAVAKDIEVTIQAPRAG